MTLLHDAPPALSPTVAAIAVGRDRWRIVDRTGRAIGHLQRLHDARGTRFRAQRFHAPTRAFRDVGEFWSAREAAECLRLSR